MKQFKTVLIMTLLLLCGSSILHGQDVLSYVPDITADLRPENPVFYLNDGDTGTAAVFNSGDGERRIALELPGESLIRGIRLYADVPAGTVFYLEYVRDGYRYPVPGSITEWRSYQGIIDISAEHIMTETLVLVTDSSSPESCLLNELEILGTAKQDVYGLIEVEDIRIENGTSVFASERYLMDGIPRTYWAKEDGSVFSDPHWFTIGALKHHFGDFCGWSRRQPLEIRFTLSGNRTLETVNLFFNKNSQGVYILEVFENGRWLELERLRNPAEEGWISIDAGGLENITEARITVQDRRGKAFGLGEVEFTGYGGTGVDSFREMIPWRGLSGTPFSATVFHTDELDILKDYELEFFVSGTLSEARLNGVVLEPQLIATTGLYKAYRMPLEPNLLLDEGNVLETETDGVLLYGRIRQRAADGLYALSEDGLGDGLLLTPAGLSGNRIAELDGDWIVDRIIVYGDAPAEIRYDSGDGSGWRVLASEEGENGTTVFRTWNSFSASRLQLNGIPETACEIRLQGRPLGNGTPSVEILFPFENSFLSKWNPRHLFVVGLTDSETGDITLNGRSSHRWGNLFWNSFHELGIRGSEYEDITVEAVVEDSVRGTVRDRVSFHADEEGSFLYLQEQGSIVYTDRSSYRLSGFSNRRGQTVRVGNAETTTDRCGFFRLDIPLEEGLNTLDVELVNQRGQTALKRVLLIYREDGSSSLRIDSPADQAVLPVDPVYVTGTYRSVCPSRIEVNGRPAEINGFRFRAGPFELDNSETVLEAVLLTSDGTVLQKQSVTVFADSSSPIITLTSPKEGDWLRDSSAVVRGTVEDASVAAVMINGTAAFIQGSNFVASVPLTEGRNLLTAFAADKAGNRSPEVLRQIMLDSQPPLPFTVSGDVENWTSDSSPEIFFSTTDAGSGLDRYEVIIDSGAPQAAVSPFELPALTDGEHLITVAAYDRMGWVRTADAIVRIDTTAPPAPISFRAVPDTESMILRWADTDNTEDGDVFIITRTPPREGGAVTVPRSDGVIFEAATDESQQQVGYLLNFEWTDEQVEPGEEYSYEISTVDKVGNLSEDSPTATNYVGITIADYGSADGSVVEFGEVKLFIGDGYLPEGVEKIIVTEVESEFMSGQAYYPIISPIYNMAIAVEVDGELQREEHAVFSEPYLGILEYDEEAIPEGFPEQNLGVYYFDVVWCRWFKVPNSVVDVENNLIIYQTNHFSSFSIQPTLVEDLSLQELMDVDYGLGSDTVNHTPLEISPQGGVASCSMTELVLPGKNGFDFVLKRQYDSSTARGDSTGLSIGVSLNFYDFLSEDALADAGMDMLEGAGWSLASQIESGLKGYFQGNGDYSYSMGMGWRLNLPYIRGGNGGVLLRTEDGGYFNINSMERVSLSTDGFTREVKLRSTENDDFILIVNQTRLDVDITSLIASSIPSDSGDNGQGSSGNVQSTRKNLIPQIAIPGWQLIDAKLIKRDGTVYYFDALGRVTKMVDPSGENEILFHYNGLELYSITDSMDHRVRFEYGPPNIVDIMPRISRIWVEGNEAETTVKYKQESLDDQFIYLPLLKEATDIQGRTYEYEYNPHFLFSGEIGVKVNILAIVLEVCTFGAANSFLGISPLTVFASVQTEMLFLMDEASGPGIGHSKVHYKDDILFFMALEPADFLLGFVPTAIQIRLNMGHRMIADELKIWSLEEGNLLRHETYDYEFVYAGYDQFYNNKTIMDDGYCRTVYKYDYTCKYRLRWLELSDFFADILDGGLFTDSPYITDVLSYPTSMSVYDLSPEQNLLERTEYGTYLSTMKRRSEKVIRNGSENYSLTRYTYDKWGNICTQQTFSKLDDLEWETVTNSVYLNSGTARDESLPWLPNPLAESQLHRRIYNLPEASLTTITTWNRNGDPITRSTQNYFRYDTKGHCLEEAEYVGGEWAVTSYDYDPDHGSLTSVVAPGGHRRELDYDYSKTGTEGTYRITTTERDVIDPDGNTTDISTENLYDYYDGKVIRSTDGNGYNTLFEYDAASRITRMERPSVDESCITEIEYDDEEGTVTVTRPNQALELYVFDDLNRLTEIHKYHESEEKSEDYVTELIYDRRGKVVSMTDPNGNNTQYGYDALGRLRRIDYPQTGVYRTMSFDYQTNRETIIDEDGIVSYKTYDWQGNVIREERTHEGDLISTEVLYDAIGNPVLTTDWNGNVSYVRYDERNNPVESWSPETDLFTLEEGILPGRSIITKTIYDPDGFKAEDWIERSGSSIPLSRIVYDNDGLGRPIRSTQHYTENGVSQTAVSRQWYDGNGQIVRSVDPEGLATNREYSPRGQLKREDIGGRITTYNYDVSDNLVGMTGPRGNSGLYPEGDFTMVLDYDDLNRLIRGELPASRASEDKPVVELEYDPRGNLIHRTDPDGGMTVKTYDTRNRVIAEQRISAENENHGYRTDYAYDGRGNLVQEMRTSGETGNELSVTEYQYDDFSRMVLQTFQEGNSVEFRYDGNGNVTAQTRGRAGYWFLTEYNALGQPVRQEDPEGGVFRFRYDGLGNLSRQEDPNGLVILRGYDQRGLEIKELRADGAVTEKSYDRVGNVVWTKDPRGSVYLYSYTPHYQVERAEVTDGTETLVTSYVYDQGGYLMSASNGNTVTTYNGGPADYRPDPYGLVWDVVQSHNGQLLSYGYEYDAMQRITGVTYSDGETVEYEFNSLGELTGMPGYVEDGSIRYDAAGLPRELTLADGIRQALGYDGNLRLTDLDYTQPDEMESFKAYHFAYDGANNIIGKGLNLYSYDGADRLEDVTLHDGFLTPPENRQQDAGNVESDVLGEYVVEFGPAETEILLDYHAVSIAADLGTNYRVTRVILTPLSSEHRIEKKDIEVYAAAWNGHDQFRRLDNWKLVQHPDGTLDIRLELPELCRVIKVHCHYNELDEENRGVDLSTFANRADAIMQVHYLEETRTETYAYDGKGNRTESSVDGNSRFYDYKDNTDLIASDGRFDYTYDANGNMTGKTDLTDGTQWTYRYNLWNQLTAVEKDGAIIAAYVYDHNGLLVQRTGAAGETTRYLHSLNGKLLEQHTDKQSRRFVYAFNRHFAENRTDYVFDGDVRIGEESCRLYFITDDLGSTVAIADESGYIVWGDGFTPFGLSTGEWGHELEEQGFFTGKFLDEDTGLYYYNARWYDPELGRFVTEDPIRDGQNWFVYASNNPLKYVDPTGLFNINSLSDDIADNLNTRDAKRHGGVTSETPNAFNDDTVFIDNIRDNMENQVRDEFPHLGNEELEDFEIYEYAELRNIKSDISNAVEGAKKGDYSGISKYSTLQERYSQMLNFSHPSQMNPLISPEGSEACLYNTITNGIQNGLGQPLPISMRNKAASDLLGSGSLLPGYSVQNPWNVGDTILSYNNRSDLRLDLDIGNPPNALFSFSHRYGFSKSRMHYNLGDTNYNFVWDSLHGSYNFVENNEVISRRMYSVLPND